jgi:broad specificity phosphatase PhoE
VPEVSKAGPDVGPAFVMPDSVPDGAALWLVRHGQTEWSKSGQHTGRTDIPLTAHGEDEARALAPLLAGLEPVLVLSSPLQRALRTAELAGLRVAETTADLAEWDYGDYEGITTEQITETVPGWTVFTHPVPHGETAAQVGARADRVLRRSAAALADGAVVLVAHGHICRVLGARWIGLDISGGKNLLLDAAAPCVLSAQYGFPVVDRWNQPNPTAS